MSGELDLRGRGRCGARAWLILVVLLPTVFLWCGCGTQLPTAPGARADDGEGVWSDGEAKWAVSRDVSLEAIRPNQLPETSLAADSPEPLPDGGYRLHVNWFGWDSDGWVDHYELMTVEDGVLSDWVSTVACDSIFIIGVEVSVAWQLAVRSVDDYGEADPSPAKLTLLISEGEPPEGRRVSVVVDSAGPN